MSSSKEEEIPVKVVDRRWWARGGDDTAPAERSTKPTYVEELEQKVLEKDKQIQEYLTKYRQASNEFDEARLRLRREISKDVERAKAVAVQIDCGAVNVNDVISNLMCTTAPMGGWKTSGMGARFGGAEGLRKYCRQEAVVAPRTNVGAGGNYYNNSPKALKRMNKLMTTLALMTPRRRAK